MANEQAVTSFTCDGCGYVIHRLTIPPGYDSSVCFICQWIDANENLTDAERAILRVKLKPPNDET